MDKVRQRRSLSPAEALCAGGRGAQRLRGLAPALAGACPAIWTGTATDRKGGSPLPLAAPLPSERRVLDFGELSRASRRVGGKATFSILLGEMKAERISDSIPLGLDLASTVQNAGGNRNGGSSELLRAAARLTRQENRKVRSSFPSAQLQNRLPAPLFLPRCKFSSCMIWAHVITVFVHVPMNPVRGW